MRALIALLAGILPAAAEPCRAIGVDPRAAREALETGSLGKVLGGKKALLETEEPGWALLWASPSRALVLIRGPEPVLVLFDRIASPAAQKTPQCMVPAEPGLSHTAIPQAERLGTTLLLNVFQHTKSEAPPERLLEIDLAGVRVGSRVILFPREGDHPRTVSFVTTGTAPLEYLLTGLSGGTCEIWRDGWLVDGGLPANPGGTLSFEGPPGSYFIRRR